MAEEWFNLHVARPTSYTSIFDDSIDQSIIDWRDIVYQQHPRSANTK